MRRHEFSYHAVLHAFRFSFYVALEAMMILVLDLALCEVEPALDTLSWEIWLV